MKKIVLTLLVFGLAVSATPTVAQAAWWNPFSWFKKSVVTTTPAVSTVPNMPRTPSGDVIHPTSQIRELTGNEKSVTAKIGDMFAILGVKAAVAGISEDSRCAVGNECLVAGTVGVKIQASFGELHKTVTLMLDKPFTLQGHAVTLTAVTPEPVAHVRILPSQYVFTFTFSTVSSNVKSDSDKGDLSSNMRVLSSDARGMGEIYKQTNGSYAGLCQSSIAVKSLKDIKGSAAVCNDSATSWAVSAATGSGMYACIDSTGTSKLANVGLTSGQTSCPTN